MANSKDLLAKFNKAFNAHDLDGLDAITADNAVLTTPTGQIRGKAAIRAYNQSWFNAFPDAKLQVVRQVVEGAKDLPSGTGHFQWMHHFDRFREAQQRFQAAKMAEQVQAGMYERFRNRTVFKRFGEPSHIASTIAFLCSEEAGYITGAAIEVAGGTTLFTA